MKGRKHAVFVPELYSNIDKDSEEKFEYMFLVKIASKGTSLIFPSVSQLALIGKLQARADLNTFEYENKESRESINNAKRSNWSSFEVAPYRNPDMSQPQGRSSSTEADDGSF